MKNLILAVIVVLASGCSLLNSSRFDHLEYDNFITMITLAEHTKPYCGSDKGQVMSRVYLMDGQADHLENYTQFRINNEDTHKIASTIQDTVDEMVKRYNSGKPVSKVYCEAKIDNIVVQAKIGAKAVQKKVRQ